MDPTDSRKWFSVSLFFRTEDAAGNIDDLWEEVVLLVRAYNSGEAEEIAIDRAKALEFTHKTVDGEAKKVFHAVSHTFDILEPEVVDGIEIFGRFLTRAEAESILKPFED